MFIGRSEWGHWAKGDPSAPIEHNTAHTVRLALPKLTCLFHPPPPRPARLLTEHDVTVRTVVTILSHPLDSFLCSATPHGCQGRPTRPRPRNHPVGLGDLERAIQYF